MGTRLTIFVAAVITTLTMISCSGGSSPIEPRDGMCKIPIPELIGAWTLEVNPVARESQSLEEGEGINIELISVDESGEMVEVDDYLTMDVFTEAYDREAQILTLRCEISFNETTINAWYEPRLYVDFNVQDDAIPEYGNKDKYVLINADGLANIRNPGDSEPEDFDPFIRSFTGLEDAVFEYEPLQDPFEVVLQIQIPNLFANDSNEKVVRWDLYLYASSVSVWLEGQDAWTLQYPPDPYAMYAEFYNLPNGTLNVVADGDVNLPLNFIFDTHIGTLSPEWDESDFVATADFDQLTGGADGFVSLTPDPDPGTDNKLEFAYTALDINADPGIYYIPARCWLDYDGYLSTQDGFNVPVFEGIFKVVVEPEPSNDNNDTNDPGGYRIFYLKDVSDDNDNQHMLFALDTLTHEEIQLVVYEQYDYSASYQIKNIVNYDISEDGSRWVFEADMQQMSFSCH